MRAFLLAVVLVFVAAVPAQAELRISDAAVDLRAPSGARLHVTRAPLELEFFDSAGRVVLRQIGPGAASAVVLPVPDLQFASIGPSPATLYAPFSFLVGDQVVTQTPGTQWEGTLQSVTQSGVRYAGTAVTAAAPSGAGARLDVATSDPSGRRLQVDLRVVGTNAFRVSVRPSDPSGVATMGDSFSSPPGEAFHGFGGRHNALDQRGGDFFNWLQQENISAGFGSSATNLATPGGDRYLFPNGQHAAYYSQSLFASSAGYGFLLDQDELSHWRMASDRPDAWQVETAGPDLNYLVIPGGPKHVVGRLSALNGRQRVPPRWALGSLFDRLVRYPSDNAAAYSAEVADDLENFKRYGLRVDGYRLEGWEFLTRDQLRKVIAELRARGIHPLLYFRLFTGRDGIGTEAPARYDQALAHGYVATHADGTPYTFISNFNADGAQIDFTNPAAVRWWKGRIRQALRLGADGFMQDFGEQVLTDMHFHDGTPGIAMHNRLPTLAHRATREAVDAFQRHHPKRHIWFFTRAGSSGTPGAAAYENANFPGDETTDFSRSSGLASLTTDMLNRAIGGAWGYTTDIGGFFDVGPYQPTTRELFERWTAWAALSPYFRLHGSVAAGTHTPWSYGPDTVTVYKRLLRLHLRARPLIEHLMQRAQTTGIPPTRPLWLAYPDDATAGRQDQEWMLGPDILVAPVVEEGATGRTVYFPHGCWRRAGTGTRVRGPIQRNVPAPVGSLPWFSHCGTHPIPR